jgi:MFS family permease
MSDYYKHEKTSHNRQAWVVTLTSGLFFFYEFIQMNLFSTINTDLREAFHLDAIQIGQLFSMYFYANFLFLFLAGNLLDRYSTRLLLLMALTVSTIGAFIFALAEQYWVAALGRFLVGAGASFCFLSCIRIASRWFAPHRMAFVTGVVVTMAMLGGLVAQTPFAMLTEVVGGWRNALYINSFLGVAIVIAVFFIVQDRPADAVGNEHEDNQHLKELGLWRCIKLAGLNPQNWLGGIYTSLMNLPVFILGGLWGVLYLTGVHHLTEDQAQFATSVFFIGVIFGSLAFGWLSDHMERRVLPMIIGAIISLVVICALMYIPNLSINMVIFLFALIGFTTSSQVLTYPTIAELNPIYLTSTAVSIDSLCIMSSGFIVPPLFGWLMEHVGTHDVVNGISVYNAQNFNFAMIIVPVSFVVALFFSFYIRETNCRSQA